MGIFHCVSSDCAQVRYQPYKKASNIRYRYPGEEWTTLNADNYKIDNGSFATGVESIYLTVYILYYSRNDRGEYRYEGAQPEVGRYINLNKSDIIKFPLLPYENETLEIGQNTLCHRIGILRKKEGESNFTFGSIRSATSHANESNINSNLYNFYWQRTARIKRLQGNNVRQWNECNFIAYLDNKIIYQEAREVCPEIEVIEDGCRLSNRIEVVQIEKLPYLHRIEVVDYAYDVRLSPLIDGNGTGLYLSKKEIPDECLNIYKNTITSLVPNKFNFLANTPENGYELVTQICSDPDCPPPEYEVICNCEEGCPSGTCEVICNGVTCCYDPVTGNAVMELPQSGGS